MENNTTPATPLSHDQNIRANQQKDQQDRQNEPQAQTNVQDQPVREPDDQTATHDQSRQPGAGSARGVNEAQRDQQIVQNQRNQHRS